MHTRRGEDNVCTSFPNFSPFSRREEFLRSSHLAQLSLEGDAGWILNGAAVGLLLCFHACSRCILKPSWKIYCPCTTQIYINIFQTKRTCSCCRWSPVISLISRFEVHSSLDLIRRGFFRLRVWTKRPVNVEHDGFSPHTCILSSKSPMT